MYVLFIGCDISKSHFDVSYYDGEPLYLGQFSNDSDGFKAMVRQLTKKTDQLREKWFICFENTGTYSKALVEWLASQQIAFTEVNALLISKSLGIRRGKNDRSDSRDLCRYAFEKRDSLEPTVLSNPLIVKLKKLLSRRDLLVKHQKALVVSVKEQKDLLDPEMLALFQKQNQATLKLYREQIKALEDQIKKILSQDPSMDRNNKMAQSVVGVGLITAAYMIAYTENFTLFVNARKFAYYAGTAPFLHHQSGVRKGIHKVSHLANKKMKSLLGMGSRAAIQFDSEIKLYYQRKIAEGKEKGLVLNNVKNKLIQRVFAAVKRQSPYVQLMTYV